MDTSKLKKFAQHARRSLREQVGSKLNIVLASDSAARRETPASVDKLEKQIAASNKDQVIEKVAYIWFNRFCALRFMDVNQYNRINVLSPLEGQFQPEILAEAKAGHIDDSIVSESARKNIFGLLDGSIKSRDGQAEAFRLLIVAVCNDYSRIMPYLFERIEDYTELLMPDDLLSGNSILAYTREAMTPEACESVESIGWLYQFYISEKKDEVFEGLKKNKKITPENIPAATQLFTPHWIVRYLVENSLGRLWMLNKPNSKVIEQMDYYIKPVEVELDFLKITSPEEIKICDPACGSGHMLTYAYDLLYAIYLDANYNSSEIPEKILTNNLYGIEIDERAAELAAFSLTMKALKGNPLDDTSNRRRFFRNPVEPNICRLEKVTFTDDELDSYINFVGKDLFTQDLRITLKEFEEADNFGSLIQPTLKTPFDALEALEAKDVSGQLFLTETHKSVLKVLKQADYLSEKYHVVAANPPYMGGKGMNTRLAKWAKDNYPDSKADLYAMFMERAFALTNKKGFMAMINMHSWMFISRYEALRDKMLSSGSIITMAHLGERAFDSIGGAVVSTTAFVLNRQYNPERKGVFLRLVEGKNEAEKSRLAMDASSSRSKNFYVASRNDFATFPGSPVAYWASSKFLEAYRKGEQLGSIAQTAVGLFTCDNDRFLRSWYEVDYAEISYSTEDISETTAKYYPYNKGGGFRKWYGLNELVVFFQNKGIEIREHRKNSGQSWSLPGEKHYFQEGVTWSGLTSDTNSFRWSEKGFVFESNKGQMLFSDVGHELLAFLNTKVCEEIVSLINPTLSLQSNEVKKIAYSRPSSESSLGDCKQMVKIARSDWDSYETSWDFTTQPLLSPDYRAETLAATYVCLRTHLQDMTDQMHKLEIENNQIFIDTYGLQDELTPDVPLEKITLTCNPAYRYGVNGTEEDRETRLRADTIAEFLGYAVGCMLGRYSLDKEGLILASRGDTFENYLKEIPAPSFMPDDDNVIPLIDFDGDWFEDDISERFKQFLKVTFGEEHLSVNLAFIEEAIGKDIKKFFLKDFYTDHLKRYKKRPIYWMFSSPKGSFNALIYMHRYRPDTVSIVLNDYLREFRTKLEAKKGSYELVEISASASQGEKTKAIKAKEKINAAIDEINDYEREIIYPLASQNIEIDLDDGVKHNYPLLGKALKKVTGLS
ncbi:MAG: type II restriction/modification system DNA methylase subunit YeeA [Pseudohongiellaceae bacterium]|jgi:type II restriction/modification system DNA methylase subunit YeeA